LKHFELDYKLSKELYFEVSVYHEYEDEDGVKRTPLGCSTFETGNILGNSLNRAVKWLKDSGSICVMVQREQKHMEEKILSLKLSVELQKESRVFYEVERKLQCSGENSSSWQPICRSDYDMDKVKSREWPESSMVITEENPSLRITLRSHSTKKGNVLIGYVETSVNKLLQTLDHDESLELDWCAPKSQGKDGENKIKVVSISIIEDRSEKDDTVNECTNYSEPTFINYITGACTLSLYVAIDYTISNGDPRKEESLHCIHPRGKLNDYESAIFSIGEVVAKYDSDQKFPVWGFGAKFEGIVRNAFQVGGKDEVDGINGILQAYRSSFQSGLVMSSPCVLTDVIRAAASRATQSLHIAMANGGLAYSILLILTQGNIDDVNSTKEILIEASAAPLSVIIVGIGNNDFTDMQFLDDYHEAEGERDICNFVEFEKYRSEDISVLRSATLDEIPEQLSSYFYKRGIMPSSKVFDNSPF